MVIGISIIAVLILAIGLLAYQVSRVEDKHCYKCDNFDPACFMCRKTLMHVDYLHTCKHHTHGTH